MHTVGRTLLGSVEEVEMPEKLEKVTLETLEQGTHQLEALASEEYGQDLTSLLASVDDEFGTGRMYFGRLLGIILKEPFSQARSTPELAGARRRWDLISDRFKDPGAQSSWQYQVIHALQQESLDYKEERYSKLEQMVEEVKRETGFFWHVLRSIRKHVCADPQFAAQLRQAIDQAKAEGSPASLPTASMAAATVATLLVTHVPWLAIAGAGLITGIIILIWRIGLDAFCSWSAQVVSSRVWYRDS